MEINWFLTSVKFAFSTYLLHPALTTTYSANIIVHRESWNLTCQPVHQHPNKQEGARGVILHALPPPPWPHCPLTPFMRGLFLPRVLLCHTRSSVALPYLSKVSQIMRILTGQQHCPVKTNTVKRWKMLENHGYVKSCAWLKAFKHHCHGITNEIGLLFFFFFSCLSFCLNK